MATLRDSGLSRRQFLGGMMAGGGLPALLAVPGTSAQVQGATAGSSLSRALARARLMWRPPNTSGYTPIQITESNNISLDPDRDYVVTKLQTEGFFQIFGGRNIVIIGGEVKNGGFNIRRTTWGRPMTDGRIVHIEGVLFSGTSVDGD